jgi:hypothetical protein
MVCERVSFTADSVVNLFAASRVQTATISEPYPLGKSGFHTFSNPKDLKSLSFAASRSVGINVHRSTRRGNKGYDPFREANNWCRDILGNWKI